MYLAIASASQGDAVTLAHFDIDGSIKNVVKRQNTKVGDPAPKASHMHLARGEALTIQSRIMKPVGVSAKIFYPVKFERPKVVRGQAPMRVLLSAFYEISEENVEYDEVCFPSTLGSSTISFRDDLLRIWDDLWRYVTPEVFLRNRTTYKPELLFPLIKLPESHVLEMLASQHPDKLAATMTCTRPVKLSSSYTDNSIVDSDREEEEALVELLEKFEVANHLKTSEHYQWCGVCRECKRMIDEMRNVSSFESIPLLYKWRFSNLINPPVSTALSLGKAPTLSFSPSQPVSSSLPTDDYVSGIDEADDSALEGDDVPF
jgi:hypothetical protein